MGRARPPFRDLTRRRLFGPAALFVSALLLGGGGPHAPLLTGLIEAVALLVLVHAAFGAAQVRMVPAGAGGASAAVLIVGALLLGLVELVPLPPAMWHRLPGREMLVATMTVLGRSGEAWPISLSLPDTRGLVLAWLPPVAMFFAALRLSAEDRLRLAGVAVVIGLLSALLGAAQLVAGEGRLFPYALPPFTRYPGLFANFNHQAMLLAACLPLTVAVAKEAPVRGPFGRRLPVALAIALLVAGVLITSSRAGLALLAVAGAVSLLIHAAAPRPPAPGGRSMTHLLRGRAGTVALAAIGAVALAGLALAGSYRWELMAGRFGATAADARFTFWPVVEREVAHYFPVGAGLGTFDIVYQAAEPLAQVQTFTVNHAHNDYLEWALETGIAGIALLALVIAWLLSRTISVWRRSAGRPGAMLARAASGVVLIVLLHSVVDYPLRTEALGCLFALACALLVEPPAVAPRSNVTRSPVMR